MSESTDELIIDKENFHKYFFDACLHKPTKGQVLAKYSGMAILNRGHLKESIIDILRKKDNSDPAVKLLAKLGKATQIEAIKTVKLMCQDLLSMTPDQVLDKPYRYQIEMFYYTQKEYVPNDLQWQIIGLNGPSGFLDSGGNWIETQVKPLKE